jgi:hypothetical protein
MPRDEDDWSDSDDEALSDLETSVLLGVPDGPIEEPKDLRDAAVSRIGGHAVRGLPSPCTLLVECKRMLFSGVPYFRSTRVLVALQELLKAYGAARAGVVSVRGQPYGSFAVCLGMRRERVPT